MVYLSLLLQLATLGLVVYVLLQLKSLFREVRVPAVRQKGQLPADFRERLRTMPRPNAEAPKERSEAEPRAERTEGRDRDRNRDGRDRDRNRDGRDRDRNREGRGDREPRSDRPEGRGDRSERTEGRDRDRNRDGRDRDRDRNRDDRGPRPQRFESAPVAEAAPAPVAEIAPVSAESHAPIAAAAPAPSFGGRRPLGPVRSSAESAPVEDSVSGALAPSSLAQPVAEAPIRHGRRSLPKAKPRFDDEPETVSQSV